MKRRISLLVTVLVLAAALAGCSPTGPDGGLPATSQPDGQAPNVWVVAKDAPVLDVQGSTVGTAYPGFAVLLQNEKAGKAVFTFAEMDDKGQNVKAQKEFSIDTSYMEKKYAEPQAVIEIISVDMIKVKPGGTLYNGAGEKLITFKDGLGPFYFIQKSDNGYMFTLDFNVVFASEEQVTYIRLS